MKKFEIQNIPDELKSINSWVVWRYVQRDGGRNGKQPFISSTCYPSRRWPLPAKTTDPKTWSSFDDAVFYGKLSGNGGIGFVFSPNIPYIGLDIDDCIINGEIITPVKELLDDLYTYSELSPSRTGIRCILKSNYSGNRNISGYNNIRKIEISTDRRYVTITGFVINDYPLEINENDTVMNEILVQKGNHPTTPPCVCNSESLNQIDVDLITGPEEFNDVQIIAKIWSSQKGKKLWTGDISLFDNDHSRADMALLCMITNWSRNIKQIDRLFRKSKLYRSKWEQKCGMINGVECTYGDISIIKALSRTKDFLKYR